MHTIRQTNGLAGFTKRSESEYDCFGTGHSSTTISAGLGTNLLLSKHNKLFLYLPWSIYYQCSFKFQFLIKAPVAAIPHFIQLSLIPKVENASCQTCF